MTRYLFLSSIIILFACSNPSSESQAQTSATTTTTQANTSTPASTTAPESTAAPESNTQASTTTPTTSTNPVSSAHPSAPAQVSHKGNAPLLGTYWKVVELNGKDMANKTAKEMHFLFDPGSPQFKSHSGCNMVMGEAKRTGNNALQFTNLLNTTSECKTPDIDAEFLKAVEAVTQYTLEGNTLLMKKNASTVLFKCTAKSN